MLKATDEANVDSGNLLPEDAKMAMEFRKISRYRWNAVDLLSIFGQRALTAHVFCDVDMSEVEKVRAQMPEKDYVTVTAFLMKAIAIAQESHPESRTFYLPVSRLVTYDKVVAGITIEKEVAGELVMFFGEVEEPQKKSITELDLAIRDLLSADIMQVPKFREQKLFAEMPWLVRKSLFLLATWFPSIRMRCQRATFGLSSLGELGVYMACVPSVCTSVFAGGAISERVVVLNETDVVIRPMLTLTLCYDQRVMDDGQAGCLVNRVRDILQGELAELNLAER